MARQRIATIMKMKKFDSYKELFSIITDKPKLLLKCIATGITIMTAIITFQIIALTYKVKTWRK